MPQKLNLTRERIVRARGVDSPHAQQKKQSRAIRSIPSIRGLKIICFFAKKVAEMFGSVGKILYLCSVIKKEKNL